MAGNNVTHTLEFKHFSNEYVAQELDKVLTCEGQDIKFWSVQITPDGNGRYKIELIMEINGEMLLLKRTNNIDNDFYQYTDGDIKVSDESLLNFVKDLIGFSSFKICKVLGRQL